MLCAAPLTAHRPPSPPLLLPLLLVFAQTAAGSAAEAAAAAADALGGEDDSDDTMLVVAAAAGFFLCMLCGGALPQWGVDAQHVMVGGMAVLMALIGLGLLVQCVRPGVFSESSFTPLIVFLFTGCIGTMLGGMFGGVLENIAWHRFEKGSWLNP